MILEIQPDLDNPSQSFETILDGVEYRILLRWNERESAWYLSISDVDDDPIASGIKVVANWPLLAPLTDERRPPGMLLAVDLEGDGDQPGLADLGRRVRLQYLDADELASG